jgi:RNA polymerase sigma-70 factor (ECF subfamily)
MWLSGDSFEAEDITSDTFVRAWAHSEKIRTETLKAYLFTIARNLYLERKRKGQRQLPLDDVYPDPAPGPERVIEIEFELRRIKQTLHSYPEIDRSAFVLRVQHELPYAEIARILQISIPASRVKVHRIRKRLLVASLDKEVV